jgi:hypothetical protein
MNPQEKSMHHTVVTIDLSNLEKMFAELWAHTLAVYEISSKTYSDATGIPLDEVQKKFDERYTEILAQINQRFDLESEIRPE